MQAEIRLYMGRRVQIMRAVLRIFPAVIFYSGFLKGAAGGANVPPTLKCLEIIKIIENAGLETGVP
jgi:hypothetical protein